MSNRQLDQLNLNLTFSGATKHSVAELLKTQDSATQMEGISKARPFVVLCERFHWLQVLRMEISLNTPVVPAKIYFSVHQEVKHVVPS